MTKKKLPVKVNPKTDFRVLVGRSEKRTFLPPAWLDLPAKKIFAAVCETLDKNKGTLQLADHSIVATYAFNIHQHYLQSVIIRDEGATLINDEGERSINPALKARDIIQKEINVQQKQLGISPKYFADLQSTQINDDNNDGKNIKDILDYNNNGDGT